MLSDLISMAQLPEQSSLFCTQYPVVYVLLPIIQQPFQLHFSLNSFMKSLKDSMLNVS